MGAGGSFWAGGYSRGDAKAVAAHSVQLYEAWELLTASAAECPDSTGDAADPTLAPTVPTLAMRFDVADVGREWLQLTPCAAAYEDLVSAWKNRSAVQVQAAGAKLMEVVLQVDKLYSL
jgi:hypothetical protein